MSPPAGFDGSGVPSLRARAALIEDLGRFVGEWRQALERGLVPSATRLAELVQKSGERQAQARAAQFGGIAHHLGRLDAEARTAPTQGISGLRQVLQDVSDMISHARTEIAAARAASPSSRPPSSSSSRGARRFAVRGIGARRRCARTRRGIESARAAAA